MKMRYSLILLLLTASCAKVGSNEWAQLDYANIDCKSRATGVIVSTGC